MAGSSRPDPELLRLAGDVREVLGRLLRTMRSQHGYPLSQASVLSRLDRGGSASIGELAVDAKVRPQSMAQTVRELEELDLVVRSADPNDARRAMIDLTPAGRTALDELRAGGDGLMAAEFAERCSPEELEAIATAMQALRRITDPA